MSPAQGLSAGSQLLAQVSWCRQTSSSCCCTELPAPQPGMGTARPTQGPAALAGCCQTPPKALLQMDTSTRSSTKTQKSSCAPDERMPQSLLLDHSSFKCKPNKESLRFFVVLFSFFGVVAVGWNLLFSPESPHLANRTPNLPHPSHCNLPHSKERV